MSPDPGNMTAEKRAQLAALGPTRPATGMAAWAAERLRTATGPERGANAFIRASRLPGDVRLRVFSDGTVVAAYLPHDGRPRSTMVARRPEGTVIVDCTARLDIGNGVAVKIEAEAWQRHGNGGTCRGVGPVVVSVHLPPGDAA